MTIVDVTIMLAGVVIVAFLIINGLDYLEYRAVNTWEPFDKGYFLEFANPRQSTKANVGGPGLNIKLPMLMLVTLVFTDGRRREIEIKNIDQVPAPGTFIKVYKNGRGGFKIEILPIPLSSCP